MEPFGSHIVAAAYGAVAHDYAEAFSSDLNRLPIDRAVLDAFVVGIEMGGRVLDVGCGPGQIGGYLADRGTQIFGVDLAIPMLRLAASRFALCTVCGDMRDLPFASGSFSGVVAFYSIQHLQRDELGGALAELHRVLTSDGLLLIATHLGEGEVFVSEFLGHQIDSVGGTLYGEDQLLEAFERQKYSIEDVNLRDPLPHEHPSQRIYILARK